MKKIKNKTSHERVPMCLGGLACLANEERGIPHVPCLLYFFFYNEEFTLDPYIFMMLYNIIRDDMPACCHGFIK